eukprot:6181232-Pleurochrysis_carterae.AAC.2
MSTENEYRGVAEAMSAHLRPLENAVKIQFRTWLIVAWPPHVHLHAKAMSSRARAPSLSAETAG